MFGAVNGACTGSTNPPICDPLPNGNGFSDAADRVGSLGGVVDSFTQDYSTQINLGNKFKPGNVR